MYITIYSPRNDMYGCQTIRARYRGADLGIELSNTDDVRIGLGIPTSAGEIIDGQRINQSGWGWDWRMDVTPSRLAVLGLRSASEVRDRAITFWEARAEKKRRESNAFLDARNELWRLICEVRERPDVRERAGYWMERSNQEANGISTTGATIESV